MKNTQGNATTMFPWKKSGQKTKEGTETQAEKHP